MGISLKCIAIWRCITNLSGLGAIGHQLRSGDAGLRSSSSQLFLCVLGLLMQRHSPMPTKLMPASQLGTSRPGKDRVHNFAGSRGQDRKKGITQLRQVKT